MNKISIIIVNWNTGSLLAKCLKSLVSLSSEERDFIDEVIIIDNASTDNSVVKAKVVSGQAINEPRVRYIISEKNLGFANGNNEGFKRIRDRHGDDLPQVWLLNPDTEVKPGAIGNMMEVLERRPKAGVLGIRLLDCNGAVQASIRNFPTFGQFVLLMLKLGRLVDSGKFDYQREQKVDQVMGASFLIRNKLWAEIGELDDDFWVWFEEVDYCKRADAAGWEVWYTPRAEVTHCGGASFGQLIGYKRSMPWLKSMEVYATKHFTVGQARIIRLMKPVAMLLILPAGIRHYFARQKNKARL